MSSSVNNKRKSDMMFVEYFRKGARIEISSNDDGFRGSWYTGTVIRPPHHKNPRNTGGASPSRPRVLVEYDTLAEDEPSNARLREELDVVQLRPPAPREPRRRFEFSDEVDAFYNDGWWEGIVTEVHGGDRYSVFFRVSREQLEFKGSDLRLHREWVHGKWVPPLEPESEENDENLSSSFKPKPINKISKHHFSEGEEVEVSSDEDGFQDSWFKATVIEKLKNGSYLVEYQSLRNDDDSGFLREEIDINHIRPCPPEVAQVDGFAVRDKVDAFYNDGWWIGVVVKVLQEDRYSVHFKKTNEEIKFRHSDLRVHQEWINGKWVVASKDICACRTIISCSH